jgi:hypothetical protein
MDTNKIDFNKWNKIKQNIHYIQNNAYVRQRQVWSTQIGYNIGREQNGVGPNIERPSLIIKKFNNEMAWVVPLSTKQKDLDFYFNFTDPEGNKVAAILAQLKLVSTKRFLRKLYTIDADIFSQIQSKIMSLLQINENPQ